MLEYRRFASGLLVSVIKEPYRNGFTYFLEAVQDDGRTWGQSVTNASEAEVAAELAALPDDFHPRTTPDPTNNWQPARTAYGSPAWGPEDEYRLACDEADAYGERRPSPFGI